MEQFVKINGELTPILSAYGTSVDSAWDNRCSITVKLEADYATAAALFTDGVAWSIVERTSVPTYEIDEETGEKTLVGETTKDTEHDKSEFVLAGDLTDHRNGLMSVKMGKLTELEEAYEMLLGGAI